MPSAEISKVAKRGSRTAARSLRLYVAGNAPNSLRAIANARAICEDRDGCRFELEIVNVLEHPKRALADGIIVTPTLLKLSPSPIQRMVGDLSDRNQVLQTLGTK
jgi:circadian clock protein KaiB